MRAFDVACSVPWAIRPDALRVLLELAARVEVSRELVTAAMHPVREVEAVSAISGIPLEGTRTVEMRGHVAILHVRGPIFRYAGLFDQMSGATSVETLAKDFHSALARPEVRALLLCIDSPGGQANGIEDFAEMVFEARAGAKPITAYIAGEGASAGYWIASAAPRIVTAPSALVGNVGVVVSVPNPHADPSTVEIVSSQSPRKRPDPTTKEGRADVQELADDLAAIFITGVARNRAVTEDTVINGYGQGALFVGANAVAAGLADEVGRFEDVLAELQEGPTAGASRPLAAAASAQPPTGSPSSARRTTMSFRERFMSWLDSQDTPAVATAETTVQTGPAPSAPPAAAAGPDPHAAELARVQAELARERADRMQERAEAFAASHIQAGRAFPAQEAALVALHAQLAADDTVRGPVPLAGGRTLARTAMLAAVLDAAPAHGLTTEALAPKVAHTLPTPETTPAAGTGPMPAERRERLLAASSLGQAVVNGKPHTN